MTIERILTGPGSAIPAMPSADVAEDTAPDRRAIRDPSIEEGAEHEAFVPALAGLAPPADASAPLEIAQLVAGLILSGERNGRESVTAQAHTPPRAPDVVVATDLRPGVGVVETTIVDGAVVSSVVVAREPPRDALAAPDPAGPASRAAVSEPPPVGSAAVWATTVENEGHGPRMVILNAAMIPGWPPPRPLVGPEPRLVLPASPPDGELMAQLGRLGADQGTLDLFDRLLARRPRLARRLLARLGLAVALLESVLATITEELGELFAEREERDTGQDLRHRKHGSDRVYIE